MHIKTAVIVASLAVLITGGILIAKSPSHTAQFAGSVLHSAKDAAVSLIEEDTRIFEQDNAEGEVDKEVDENTDANSHELPSDEEIARMAGGMIIAGFRGTRAPEDSYVASLITDVKPGGVILFDRDLPSGNTFPRNITSPAQVRALVSEVKRYADYQLLVSVDAEGGRVNRLNSSYGFVPIPSHQTLGQGTTGDTFTVADQLARQLSGLGIALNFSPVIDLNSNPQSPAIGALGRSFSADPALVIAHAAEFIRAHENAGILTTLKHFPGHGSATGDTHLGVVDITATWSEKELEPYRKLISGGYNNPIMTAHVVNRNYSPLPATLSPQILTGLLREELGFTGVIITDDMQMGAIRQRYGLEEAAIRAIEAGADMLIISNNIDIYDPQAPYRVRDAIIKAVSEGRLSTERLEASHRRILRLTQ